MIKNPIDVNKTPGPVKSTVNLDLPEEVIEKIIERVYRMIMSDLKMDYERNRGLNSDFHRGIR